MRERVLGVLLLVASALLCAPQLLAVCPAPPNLVGPTDPEVPFGLVLLDWDDPAGATTYDVYIGLDGDPLGLHESTTTSQMAIEVEPGRYVEWKVAAKANTCADAFSAHFMFQTSCPDEVPMLQGPEPGQHFAPGDLIEFNWTAVAGAAGYDVNVTPDFGQTFEIIAENLTTTSFSTDDLPEGDWGWYVRANFNGSCDPAFSEPSFFLIGDCSSTPTELLEPANGATGVKNPVTFRWAARDGAEKYTVLVSIDGSEPSELGTTTATELTETIDGNFVAWAVRTHYGENCDAIAGPSTFSLEPRSDGCPTNPESATLVSPPPNAMNLASPVTFDWNPVPFATGYQVLAVFEKDQEPVTLGLTTETALTVALPASEGVWFVQTFFGEDCPRTLSERRAFQVTQGAPCGDAKPILTQPANGATDVDSPVTFKWNGVPNAIGYALFVSINNSTEFDLYGVTDETEIERLVPDGIIRWFVVAKFAACDDTRSDTFQFVAGDTSCGDPVLTLNVPPDGAQVSSPVTLSWNPVANATAYRVLVTAADGSTVLLERTTATQATLRFPKGEIRWRVEALRANDCPSVLSEQRRFIVTEGANCASNVPPTLISPVGTEAQPATAQSPVNLQWNATPNAIAYSVWMSSNGQPFGEVAFTRETNKQLIAEPGRHAWLVYAIFEGCDRLPSAIAFFNVPDPDGCSTTAPTVLSPTAGQVVDTPVTITWTAVPRALKYRVVAQIKGEGPFILGVTERTEFSASLPPSDDPGDIIFLVQAVFERCAATESARIPITVRRAQNCSTEAPALVSPPNESTVNDPEVTFVWTPVSGAIKYAVVVEFNDGPETILGFTDNTQLTHLVPAGHIDWRVVAFLPGCDPVRSGEFELDVARPQNCGTRKPVLLFPKGDRETTSPVHFAWTGVPNAVRYRVRAGLAGTENLAVIAETADTQAAVDLAEGTYIWMVDALFDGPCPPETSAEGEFTVGPPVPCGTPEKPRAQVIGRALSGTKYRVRWTALPNVQLYEVQEATSLAFEDAQTFTTDSLSLQFSHDVTGTPVQFLYRVRGLSDCNEERGPYSDVVGVFIIGAQTNNSSAELGDDAAVVQRVFLPGGPTPLQFVATTDKPWLTVNPSSGTLPVDGLTLTVTANPGTLPIGTNTATISIQYTGASGKIATHGSTTSTVPVSVSLVTPVAPGGTGTPPPDALIFGAVGHAQGQGDSLFESDIRLTNLTAQTMQYELHYTPSGTNGTENGLFGSLEVAPSTTVALDDVVASLFGEGTVSGSVGMLEVRPVTPTSSSGGFFGGVVSGAIEDLHTVASSRTYNFTPTGTFGQFIPATQFSDFVGRNTILSLQQVAQSAAYRANFGFLEASGQPVDMQVRVYDVIGTLLATIPVSLGAMEHRQLNLLLVQNGITDLADGRVEVEVLNGEGKVTAYVSEVDNATNDPLLVSAEVLGARTADRYALPGIATFQAGSAYWVSDVRIFNAGTTSTPATLTFYPMGNPGGALTRDITIDAGEIEVLNNVMTNLFGQASAAGAIIITTPAPTQLTATARTYNQTDNGTYGQYIPAVTPEESVGAFDRALQILQVEQSSRFRTNIGVQETSGQPVTVEVSLITPDSLTTPVVTLNLAANEFRQFGLVDFGLTEAVYNGRVTVKAINGLGRVTAYGSAIDSITQDPTYVPAQ